MLPRLPNKSFKFNRGLGFYKNLRLNEGLRLNPLVCLILALYRYTFNRLVPYGCKFVRASVPRTKVPSFAYCKFWGEEIRMPYVNIGEKGTVN